MECVICKNSSDCTGAKRVCKDCVADIRLQNKYQCEYCGEEKEKSLFSKARKGTVCKSCKRSYDLDNKKEYGQLHYKDYYEKNKEKIIKKTINWNNDNKEKRLLSKKKYRDAHKNDIDFRIKENLGCRLRNLFKKGNNKFIDFLGCDIQSLKKWLEFNFTKDMSWDNYGSLWHIDHIIPCAAFKDSSIDMQKLCWNWSNLAPLDAIANASKGKKIKKETIMYYTNRVNEFLKYYEEGSESIRQQVCFQEKQAQDVLHSLLNTLNCGV